MAESLLSISFRVVSQSKQPLSFQELWDLVAKDANLSEEDKKNRISQFYTNLILDGRFVDLGDNVWDLSSRHTYEQRHIDMSEIYNDIEQADDDQDEEKERLEEEGIVSSEDEESSDDEDKKEEDF